MTTLLMCILSTASPHEMLESAQTHIAAEQWVEAAETLDALVATTENPAPAINYDRGIAHYQLEQYEKSAKAFEDAMASTDDPTLASYCAYNFGNAIYQATLRDLDGTTNENGQEEAIIALEVAKEQLSNTIDSYRRAIAKNADDVDARANGELAWKMLQLLDEMQEEMKQQQKQQQDDQNQEQQQDDESAEEQADNQENSEQGDSQKEKQEQQDGQQSDSEDQESSENQQGEENKDQKQKDSEPSDQKKEGEQSDAQQEKQDKQENAQPSEEQNKGQDEQPSEPNQTEADQSANSEQPNPTEETSEQEKPDIADGELEAANEAGKQEAVEQQDVKEEGERLSRSEASRLLQLIRDKEKQRRRLLAARKAARRVPVQKDW